MAAIPAAVAPHYYAISPDEGVHSAHELPQEEFINLVEVDATIADLDDLFGQRGTGIPACPPGWAGRLRAALVGQDSEDLMNASIQELFNESFPDHQFLEVEGHTRVREQSLSTMLGFEHGNGLPIKMSSRPGFGLRSNHIYISLGKERMMRIIRSTRPFARTRGIYLPISTARSSAILDCHLLCMESQELAPDVTARRANSSLWFCNAYHFLKKWEDDLS